MITCKRRDFARIEKIRKQALGPMYVDPKPSRRSTVANLVPVGPKMVLAQANVPFSLGRCAEIVGYSRT
jgi:hypothetical protein